MSAPICGVPFCTNEAVREMVHKKDAGATLKLCAYHVRRMMKYVTDDQLRDLVFPGESAHTKEGA